MPKGRKKAWLKKVDISDITEGARQRTEDILRGGKVEEKPSDELFVVEKKKKKPSTSV